MIEISELSEIEGLLEVAFRVGGRANTMIVDPAGARWLRRYVMSGVWVTAAKRDHKRKVKADRRRNRGRGPFAKGR